MTPGSERSPLFAIARRVREVHFSSMVCAHRGDSQNAPENTMAAFRAAIDCDAEFVEMDIRETKEGELAVIHDSKLERTSDGLGEVKKYTLKELQRFDAGSWFDTSFAGEPIPSIDEFLELVKGKIVPMIEIKDRYGKAPSLAAMLVNKLKNHGMLDQVIVIATDKAHTLELAKLAPDLVLSIVSFTGFQGRSLLKQRHLHGLDHYWKTLSPKLIQDAWNAGFFITPWTINKRVDMLRCLALGIECIITDSPRALRDAIEEYEVQRVSMPLEIDSRNVSEIELEILNEEELDNHTQEEW